MGSNINYNITPTHHTIDSIPGDKSISHRAIILGSIASNTSSFTNFLMSEDCKNTITIFKQLGVQISIDSNKVVIEGVGLKGLTPPKETLDVGNSGTSIRLITGLLAAQPFSSLVTGDSSIQSRPMKRIIDPLSKMGAVISGKENENNDICAPLSIAPSSALEGITYTLPVASAQVKSAILLASLYSKTPTTIIEPKPCRNHTEVMLKAFKAPISINDNKITLSPPQELMNPSSNLINIPSDFSSAAFFIVLGLICKNTSITLTNIGINKTRSTLIDILKKMGADILIENIQNNIEPTADITVHSSSLQNIHIPTESIAFIIDEIPILAVAAMFAKGKMTLTKAKELRFKESDRIKKICHLITEFGGTINELSDGFELEGGITPQNANIITDFDHRIAMSAVIASIASQSAVNIDSIECIKTSFPNFMDIIETLGEKTHS